MPTKSKKKVAAPHPTTPRATPAKTRSPRSAPRKAASRPATAPSVMHATRDRAPQARPKGRAQDRTDKQDPQDKPSNEGARAKDVQTKKRAAHPTLTARSTHALLAKVKGMALGLTDLALRLREKAENAMPWRAAAVR